MDKITIYRSGYGNARETEIPGDTPRDSWGAYLAPGRYVAVHPDGTREPVEIGGSPQRLDNPASAAAGESTGIVRELLLELRAAGAAYSEARADAAYWQARAEAAEAALDAMDCDDEDGGGQSSELIELFKPVVQMLASQGGPAAPRAAIGGPNPFGD